MTNSRVVADSQIQRSFGETEHNAPDVESKIDVFVERKEQAKAPVKARKIAKDEMEKALDALELPDGEHRFGEYIVKRSSSEPKEVSFERASKRRYSVKSTKK